MPSPSAAGVAAGFPEPSAYLKKLTFGFNSRILQARLDDIQRVSRVGLGFEYVLDSDTFTYSMHRFGDDLWAVFVTLRREAMRQALEGKPGWETGWRRALTYGYWSLAMQMDARLESIARNAASGGTNFRAPALEWFGGVAGDCLALGWNDYARDRHTHQCRSTDTDMEFDLPFEAFWYDPYEILAVLRLRASAGLDNPALDRPLLATPLGRLQGPSAPALDEALAAAVARVRQAGQR